MGIIQSLSVLALRQVAVGACRTLGVIGIDAAAEFLTGRFTDNSRRLAQALQGAAAKAWQSLEIALAGESLWNKLDDADGRAFRLQLRAFLDSAPIEELPARDADFRAHCLRELRAARKSGLLLGGTLDSADLARQAANLTPFADSAGLVEREWQALDNTADLLREARYNHLARLVALRPGGGQLPLIAIAVRYFFRRAVEQDAELHRGLSFAQWDALAEDQQRGFEQLNSALDGQGRRLDEMLDVLGEVRGAVLDLRQEIAGQRDQIRQLAHDVMDVLGQHQLERRELRGGDSLSIRNDDERRLVKDLVARYRALPPEQRHGLPALLNAVGKMEVVAGNFDSARRDFEELVQIVPDERGRAEALFNAYQAALECRQWDEALTAYKQAAALDAERFSLFPLGKYEAERILGAGGFGVAFLCKDRHTGSRVVIKAVRADGLDRTVIEVFAEARALEELSDDSIIRLRHCDCAGANNTRPYLVMDYFEGVPLADHVAQRGPLQQAEAVVLLGCVARALQKAHNRGICHRDVKPANILVAGGRVKLIDFGLALRQRTVQTTIGSASSYTQTLMGSSIAGTIDYAAPEQLGKRPGDKVGPHSDVYGLGKTACYTLFGTTMPLARHWRGVPAELADLLGQCLAEDPKERPASCQEVADRLTGAAPVSVAQAVPVAQPAPVTPAEESPAKPPDPLPHLIVGGLFGAGAGLFAGIQRNWSPDSTAAAVLMVFMSLTVGLAATIGRRQHKLARVPAIPGLAGAALGLSIPLIYSIHGLLWKQAMHYGLQQLGPESLLNLAFLLILAWGIGYGWGRVFGQTAAVMAAMALIALFGVPSQTAAFAFGGLLIGGIAAFVFEVATPFRVLDHTLDRMFLSLLEPIARVLPAKPRPQHPESPVPAAKQPPPTPAARQPSLGPDVPAPAAPSVALAIRLPLLLLACGLAGLGVGTNSGAAGLDIESFDRSTLMLILMALCGVAGTFVIAFSHVQGFLHTLFWLIGGAAVSFGLAGLVGGLGWYGVNGPAGIMAGLLVWGSAIGTMAGTRLGHPVRGLLGGASVSALAIGGGWVFGHPDPAGLLGIGAGLLGGTLLWRGLERRWLLAARGAALVLFLAAGGVIWLFQPELGWRTQPFESVLSLKESGQVRYGDVRTPEQMNVSIVHAPALDFSSDGQRLLSEDNGTVLLWDTTNGRLRDPVPVGRYSLIAAGFSGTEPRYLACKTSPQSAAVLHAIENGAVLSSVDLSGLTSPSRVTAAVGADGMMLVRSDGNEISLVILYSNGQEWKGKISLAGTVTAAAVSGNRLLLGFSDGTIRLAEREEKEFSGYSVLNETRKLTSLVTRLAFSPSGRHAYAMSDSAGNSRDYVFSASRGGLLLAWNVEEWKDFFTISSGPARATCAAFSPDGRLLLAGTDKGTVQVWNIASQERTRTYKLNSSFILDRRRSLTGVAVSPNGRDIAAVSDSGRILLWHARELDGAAKSKFPKVVGFGKPTDEAIIRLFRD